MFDHDDDSRGFWDDEPTRPLERFTARMKPAGSPPPQPSRLWANRANQPSARQHNDTGSIPVVAAPPVRRVSAPPYLRQTHEPTRQQPVYDQTMFDDLDEELGYDAYGNHDADATREVWGDEAWSDDTRWGTRRTKATRTGGDDNWPASIGQAVGMAARKGRELLHGRGTQIDPLMRRIGVMVLIIVLLIPLALTLRGGEAESKGIRPDDTTLAMGTQATITAAATQPPITPTPTAAPATPAEQAASRAVATPQTAAAPLVCAKSYTVVKGDFWVRIAEKSNVSLNEVLAANNASKTTLLLPGKTVCLPANATTPAATATTAAATAPPTTAPACTKKYTIVKGDAWSIIAKKASITTTQLLAANNASKTTLLLPGKTVCLPANATTPTAPTTTVKPTPTTVKPTPTTVAKPAIKIYTRAEVQQIIRDVFPADQIDKAFAVAERESHFNQNSQNSCCYGVFQINFNAHKKWLVNYGVTSPTQLLDPVINVQMALVVYQRSNGWGPWGG
ncbi:MAG: LysM peptidoglycan-binding domain-containing protein [Actinomycetota bacterium]|nr:LysM peptidoglycan-binding domain-containing protein [Actinomycetota bacterium]